MSNFNNIFDNKIKYQRRFDIDLAVESVYTIDYGEWINRSIKDDFEIPWDLLNLTVDIDNVVIYQGMVGSNGVQLHYDLPDSDLLQHHRIKIAVSGFSPAHSFLHKGQEINAQLLISQFKIEHLDLIPLVSKEGIKIFDDQFESDLNAHELLRGNHSQIFDFTTPIYPWLLSKFNDINHH